MNAGFPRRASAISYTRAQAIATDGGAANAQRCAHPASRTHLQPERNPADRQGAWRRSNRAVPPENDMTAPNAAADMLSAIAVMQRAHDACADLQPLDRPMSEQELRQRAALIEKVIHTRKLLQRLRDRAEVLRADLDRFKQRREAMRT